MDIVERLRQGTYNDRLDDDIMQEAATEIERWRKDAPAYANVLLSEENDRLIDENKQLRSDLEYARKRAEKAEAALEHANSPVWDSRNDYEGPGQAPYHPPECGGFQGHED